MTRIDGSLQSFVQPDVWTKYFSRVVMGTGIFSNDFIFVASLSSSISNSQQRLKP